MEKTPHILIADDYHQMRLAVQHVLSEMELHNVHQAVHGQEARYLLESNPITLVIADWNMPGMTGYDLLCWCRSDAHYRNVPFILLTAEADKEHLEKAITAGASDYLVKPFTAATLRARILKQLHGDKKTTLSQPLPQRQVAPVLGLDAPSEERLARSTILIVDDVATNIEVIAGILKGDYAIKVAINGRRALEIANGVNPPDLILLDVMMPELDGFEVCRRLQDNERTRDIPIIFLTARDQIDDVVDGFGIGAVDYVIKPAQPEVLKARIRTHLRLTQAARDLKRQNLVLADNARLREDIERITHHDLKNPLGAIAQTVSMLKQELAGQAQLQEKFDLLESATQHALDMVSLSLTLYKIEQGNYQVDAKQFALSQLLQGVIDQLRLQFSWKKLRLPLGGATEAMVLAEPTLCRALFGNLLRNAMEAAPEGSEIRIQLDLADGMCSATISNQGVVPDAIRSRFFDKYATAGKAGGTGLGTYSAKILTEAQGGEIEMRCDDELNLTQLRVSLKVA